MRQKQQKSATYGHFYIYGPLGKKVLLATHRHTTESAECLEVPDFLLFLPYD